MNKRSLLFPALLLLALLTGCGRTRATPDPVPATAASTAAPTVTPTVDVEERRSSFDRHAMLAGLLENVIRPVHAEAVVEAAALEEAAHAFVADPSDETLAPLQEQWRRTAEAWIPVELYRFRATMILHNQIHKWPANQRLITGFLEGEETIDRDFVAGIGSTSRGLPAMEYLLFDPELTPDEILALYVDDPLAERRRAYLLALAENVAFDTAALQVLWGDPDGDDGADAARTFLAADLMGDDLNSSISMVSNQMVFLLERTANDKLGKPLGFATFGEPAPAFAEAGRSGHSLALLRRDLLGFRQAFTGSLDPSADAPGFDDYLDYLRTDDENHGLAAAILAQTDAALIALDAIQGPLTDAVVNDHDAVAAAYEAVKDLLVLVKVDMANQLGVTITFSDNDGD